MAESNIFLQIFNYGLFVVLCGLGVLFLLASPVDPSMMVSRLIVGIILIVLSIVILVILSLLIQRRTYTVVKTLKEEVSTEEFYPFEIICNNCRSPIEITEDLKTRENVICHKCGEENIIPKDNIKW